MDEGCGVKDVSSNIGRLEVWHEEEKKHGCGTQTGKGGQSCRQENREKEERMVGKIRDI